MSFPKILLTGLAALAFATPTLAQQKINCDTKLEGMIFYTNKIDSFTIPINTLAKDYTPEEFQCMSEGIAKKTNGKFQFIKYGDKEKSEETGYILERINCDNLLPDLLEVTKTIDSIIAEGKNLNYSALNFHLRYNFNLSPEEFQCISDGIEEQTDEKYQFIQDGKKSYVLKGPK